MCQLNWDRKHRLKKFKGKSSVVSKRRLETPELSFVQGLSLPNLTPRFRYGGHETGGVGGAVVYFIGKPDKTTVDVKFFRLKRVRPVVIGNAKSCLGTVDLNTARLMFRPNRSVTQRRRERLRCRRRRRPS